MALSEGDEAPEFCLKDSNGKDVCLKDLRGKWVVLYFYPKDNTPGCTKEAIGFTESLEEFKGMNAMILGVSPDSEQSHIKFIDKHGLKVTLLSDPERGVLQAYGAWREKSMYGKTFLGVIRSTFVISPDGKIVRTWDKVKVKGHVDDVLNCVLNQQ